MPAIPQDTEFQHVIMQPFFRAVQFLPSAWRSLCLISAGGRRAEENLCTGRSRRLAQPVKWYPGAAALIAAALLAGCVASRPKPGPSLGGPRDPSTDTIISVDDFDGVLLAKAIFWETNRQREANGLASLAPLAALDGAADEQAEYTALSLATGHENMFPNEHNVAQRVAGAGLHPLHLSENAIMMPARRPVGAANRDYTYAAYAGYLLDGWMNSPGHRAAVLDPQVTFLGCAARIARGFGPDDQRIFAVQVFFKPDPWWE